MKKIIKVISKPKDGDFYPTYTVAVRYDQQKSYEEAIVVSYTPGQYKLQLWKERMLEVKQPPTEYDMKELDKIIELLDTETIQNYNLD